MPLEFLRRRGGGPSAAPVAPVPPPTAVVPEESIAEEHALRLTFAAKTSAGVRLTGGPQLLAALPGMMAGVALTEPEVVEPRDTSLAVASPNIVHAAEATEWLRAHAAARPITRHALYVLESLDAIDPAYDTFVCALLDGELDTAGYPEYAAIVGGVAAHWDESTGDLIVRAVVGWGGRGARGDTDRIATRILGLLLGNILETSGSLGLTQHERPIAGPGGVTCPHCAYAAVPERAMFCPKCGMRMRRS